MDEKLNEKTLQNQYDVVIVGGGAAGLSAGLALGRARRSVLVIDAGSPRNAPAGHVHNYLGREGTSPAELLAIGRAEVAQYGGQVVTATVTAAAARDGGGFDVDLADGRTVSARRLLITTGLKDELPDLPGVAERWGNDVLHCPYCHGWEVRDQAIGVLFSSPMSIHQALMFRQWSADITLFLNGRPGPDPEVREQLDARGIVVVDGELAGLEVADDRLVGIRLKSGGLVAREALVVTTRMIARADVLSSLGLEATDMEMAGHVVGSYVAADANGATALPGVWVAGNVADLRAQVISSAAGGLNAATMINADLIAEDTRIAVDAHRARAAAPAR